MAPPQGAAPGWRRGAEVLGIGFGTGLVARKALEIIGPSGRLVGVDPSAAMMSEAQLPYWDTIEACVPPQTVMAAARRRLRRCRALRRARHLLGIHGRKAR